VEKVALGFFFKVA